jgi:hypothetical protein
MSWLLPKCNWQDTIRLLNLSTIKNKDGQDRQMATGFRATFALRWEQTEINGRRAAPPEALFIGASWRWTGEAVRMDAGGGALRLESPLGMADLHRRAAQRAGRLLGMRATPRAGREAEPGQARRGSRFAVTDGSALFPLSMISGQGRDLVVAHGALPPQDCDLWVVELALDPVAPTERDVDIVGEGGLICFTPGTLIRTATGVARIEDLRPDDRIQTKDNGLQAVLWQGARHIGGARLRAMPWLRPVRLLAGALGEARPEADLTVSPRHRMLVQGPAAQALFNTGEVLVAAADLVNDHTIRVDNFAREVTYIHVLLDAHNILWANGMETESFLPDRAALDHLDPASREMLLAAIPGPAGQQDGYGGPARRSLSRPEAALLQQA